MRKTALHLAIVVWLAGCNTGPQRGVGASADPASARQGDSVGLAAVTNSNAQSVDPQFAADARAAVDKWLETLKTSACAKLKFSAERTTLHTPHDTGETEVKSRIPLRAEVVMLHDAHWLVVWEGRGEPGDRTEPVLTLEFRDGQIRERLWYPEHKEYRTTRYEAPTRWGANDTPYEQGCQFGTLLHTWLGESRQRSGFESRLYKAELLQTTESVGGHECFVLKSDSGAQAVKLPQKEYTEHRIDYYLIDHAGLLRLWRTVVTVHASDEFVEITQIRDYDWQFMDAAPADLPAPSIDDKSSDG